MSTLWYPLVIKHGNGIYISYNSYNYIPYNSFNSMISPYFPSYKPPTTDGFQLPCLITGATTINLPTHGQDGLVFLRSSEFVMCFVLEKTSRVINGCSFFVSEGVKISCPSCLKSMSHVSGHGFRCLGDRLAGRRSNASTRGGGVTFRHRRVDLVNIAATIR